MAKKSTKKNNKNLLLTCVVVAVMSVLVLLTALLPVLNYVGSITDTTSAKGLALLRASSIVNSEETEEDVPEEVTSIILTLYGTAPTKAVLADKGTFEELTGKVDTVAVINLITAIFGVLGVLCAVGALFSKQLAAYIGYIAILIGIIAIVNFVFAIIASSALSSSVGLTVIKVQIGIGPILALVGGLLGAAAPFGLKKVKI